MSVMCKLIFSTLLVLQCYKEYYGASATSVSTTLQPTSSNVASSTTPSSTGNHKDTSQYGNPTYVGCFRDFDDSHKNIYQYTPGEETLGACYRWCVGLRTDFAAITQSEFDSWSYYDGNDTKTHIFQSYCFCGFYLTDISRRVNDTQCSRPCTDLPGFTCGGIGHISVYDITHLLPPAHEANVDTPEGSEHILMVRSYSVKLYNSSDLKSPQVLFDTPDAHICEYADYHHNKNLAFVSTEARLYKTMLFPRNTSELQHTHILDIGRCSAFTVDWVHDRIFWVNCSDTSNTLNAVDLDGKSLTTIRTGISRISKIVVDPYSGMLFWANRASGIESCESGGANLRTTVNQLVADLTLDISNERLFYFVWIELKSTLNSVDYSGNEPKTYLEMHNIFYPTGLETSRGFLYWIERDWDSQMFFKALPHNNSSLSVKPPVVFINRDIRQLKIIDPGLQKGPESGPSDLVTLPVKGVVSSEDKTKDINPKLPAGDV